MSDNLFLMERCDMTTSFGYEQSSTFDIQCASCYPAEFDLDLRLIEKSGSCDVSGCRFVWNLGQMKEGVPAAYCEQDDPLNIRYRFRQPVWDLVSSVVGELRSGKKSVWQQKEAAEHLCQMVELAERHTKLQSLISSFEKDVESIGLSGVKHQIEPHGNTEFDSVAIGKDAAEFLAKFVGILRERLPELMKRIQADFAEDLKKELPPALSK